MGTRDIAILMYHHVKPGSDMVNVQPDHFANQIKTLAENGVDFLSWQDFLAINEGKYLERNIRKGVLVTFDDGFLDNYWYAYPVLKKYNVPFILFVTPDRMPPGTETEACRDIGSIALKEHRSYAREHTISDQFVNRAELMDMVNSGLCEVGAHTLVHWRCETHDERSRHEIAASKTAIEALTQKPCDTFAWPYGQTQAESLAWAKEVGYKGIFTIEHGLHARGSDMFQIRRFNVKDKPGDYLMARLNLHWMPFIGRLYARIKGIVVLTFIATLAAVTINSSAQADVLYMRNNTILFGIIEKDLGEQYQLAISKGDITVPKKNIRRIEYDYKARFTALEADDLQGHLELGEFCVKKGLLKEAAEQYEYVTTLEGFPPYVHKTLGDLYMELEDYNKAYIAYDQYVKKTKRKDKELAQKMAKANQMRRKASKDLKQSQPEKEAGAEEGFEQYATWTVEKWGNPCAVLNQTIDDNKLLRVDFQSGGKDKTAIGYPLNGDISDKTKLTFSIFNNQELPMQIAIAFVTNPGWGWHESKSLQIQPKWNVGTELNITGNDFKSEATKWTFTTPILNKKNVKKVFFLIYNGKKDGTFFIDDIKFE